MAGVDFVYTDVWLSMGEPDSAWDERIRLLRPFQVNGALLAATGNPDTRFLHCLPACHTSDTATGRRILDHYGLAAMEVTDERLRVAGLRRVRPGGEPAAHHQGPDGGHDWPADVRLVVAVGGNALLERGERPEAELQEHHAPTPWRPSPRWPHDHDLVVTHGNGPQVGLLAVESTRDPDLDHPSPSTCSAPRPRG